jgi:ADP-ribose pyrophosphatase YjhB (NUDIX family)
LSEKRIQKYPRIPLLAVGALIEDHGRLLLLQRRYNPGRGKWSLPGGMVKLGETLEEALIREVREELNMKIVIEKSLGAYEIIERKDHGHVEYHYVVIDYVCHPTGGRLKGNREAMAVRWFRPDELGPLALTASTRRLLSNLGYIP